MLTDAKMNFRGSQNYDIWCSVCYLFPETQKHIYDCYVLRTHLKDKIKFDDFSYDNIDGTLEEQEKFAQMFCSLLEARRIYLDVSPRESQSTEDLETYMEMNLLFAT